MHQNWPEIKESASLREAVRFFTEQSRVMACLHIRCGQADLRLEAMGGVRDLEGRALERDSLFDLASLTKVFTAVLVLLLRDRGSLDLDAPVTRYAPDFRCLSDVPVRRVLGFGCTLRTPCRVDGQEDAEKAEAVLFQTRALPSEGRRVYSDMHAMVLRYVLEGASGLPYMEILRREILLPLGMHNTFCPVPESRRDSCVSCDLEHRIENGERKVNRVPPGVCHDPKARVMGLCPGHAGLFADMDDMERFARGLLEGRILKAETLGEMAVNRTGEKLADGSFRQFLGYQCYVRHPQQVYSEVPAFMSDHALAISGFTGHHMSLDLDRGFYILALGNRVLNRLTFIAPSDPQTCLELGLTESGRGRVLWDGQWIESSAGYVFLRDQHMHARVLEAMEAEGRTFEA